MHIISGYYHYKYYLKEKPDDIHSKTPNVLYLKINTKVKFRYRKMATIASQKLVCLQDYEQIACETLPSAILSFYKGGADQEITLRDNREALKRFKTYNIIFKCATFKTKFRIYLDGD